MEVRGGECTLTPPSILSPFNTYLTHTRAHDSHRPPEDPCDSDRRGAFTHVNRLPATYTLTPFHMQTHTRTLAQSCRHTDSLELCINIYTHTPKTHSHKHILTESAFAGISSEL